MSLHIANSIALPMSAVTQRIGIVGSPGSGKTHLGVVVVEEMLRSRVPVIIIDPEGAWWGLRSSADGKSPGFKVVVLGGREGDRRLEPGAGIVVADFCRNARESFVLDLSDMEDEEQYQFVGAFCQRIYKLNREPLHVVIDEADKFCPQTPEEKGQMISRKGVRSISQRARLHGVGCTVITQRPAVLDKTVLNLCQCLFAFNTPAPLDQQAIEKWMVSRTGKSKSDRDAFVTSLGALERGVAWMWSPSWLKRFEKVSVRERTTYDSSKTPEFGVSAKPPTKQKIDLAELESLMQATIAQAKEDDPVELRRRIAALEAKLREQRPSAPVEVPVIDATAAKSIEAAVRGLMETSGQLYDMTKAIETTVTTLEGVKRWMHDPRPTLPSPVRLPATRREPTVQESKGRRPAKPEPVGGVKLKKGERGILAALVTFGGTLSPSQLATIMRIKVKGSTMRIYVGKLQTNGYVAASKTEIAITDKGRSRAGSGEPPPKTVEELVTMWGRHLKAGERAMLDMAVQYGSRGVDRSTIARSLAIDEGGSTMRIYLGHLRTTGLIVERDERFYMGAALTLLADRHRATA